MSVCSYIDSGLAVSKICDWASEEGMVDRIEILGFVDYKRSVDWIKKAGGSVINLLAKGSEKHCREQLGRDLTSHIDDISSLILKFASFWYIDDPPSEFLSSIKNIGAQSAVNIANEIFLLSVIIPSAFKGFKRLELSIYLITFP